MPIVCLSDDSHGMQSLIFSEKKKNNNNWKTTMSDATCTLSLSA